MELNRDECIELLQSLGRKQHPGCEGTIVLTESQVQEILKALVFPPKPAPKPKTKGRIPE